MVRVEGETERERDQVNGSKEKEEEGERVRGRDKTGDGVYESIERWRKGGTRGIKRRKTIEKDRARWRNINKG